MAHVTHSHQHSGSEQGDRRVLWAVAVNVALTVVQIVGGVWAGSLALVADAVHNYSEAASLGIAFAARRIARKPSDDRMTFGYVRAEIVAALINYTTLIVVGLYLAYEACLRFVVPHEVQGWPVVIIAAVALAVDTITALLTYALSKRSMNIRAAFLHNLADALGSIGVIVAGTLVILYGWHIVDPIVTLMIAAYVLWQAFSEIGGVIRILMLGVPSDLDVRALVTALEGIEGVAGVTHVHVWAIDEDSCSLEAHIQVRSLVADAEAARIKRDVRALARDRFGIGHCTLELEDAGSRAGGERGTVVGH